MKKKVIDFPNEYEMIYSKTVKKTLNEISNEYSKIKISEGLKNQITNITEEYLSKYKSSGLNKKNIETIILKQLEYKYNIEKETFKYFDITKTNINFTAFVKENVGEVTTVIKDEVDKIVLYEADYMKKTFIKKVEQLEKKESKIKIKDIKKIQKEARNKTLRQAELTARNKSGNLYSDTLKDITKDMDCQLRWITENDGRVRPEHAEREGVIYNIDDLDLWPGEDYGCRCQGEIIQK